MGYQITWKKSNLPELDNRFKSYWSEPNKLEETLKECKTDLLITLMRLNETSDIRLKELNFKIRLYINCLEEQWKLNLKSRLENDEEDLWFCGWEYSSDKDPIELNFEYLYLYALCSPKCNAISDESDGFWDKYHKIIDELYGFDELVWSNLTHDFVDTYREYSIKNDDQL